MPLKVRSRKNQTQVSLKKLAWDYHSRVVRLKAADWRGNVRCYTCDKTMHWKEADAGHFKHLDALDHESDNIRVQCTTCNRYNHGRGSTYAIKLAKEIGMERVEWLDNFRGKCTFNMTDYQNFIAKYKKILEAYDRI